MEDVPSLVGQLARLNILSGPVEDRNAEVAINVDVGVADASGEEAEGGWLIRVVGRETHFGFEISTMPNAVGVDDPKAKLPAEKVGFVGLDVYPFLLLQRKQFLHQSLLCHCVGVVVVLGDVVVVVGGKRRRG